MNGIRKVNQICSTALVVWVLGLASPASAGDKPSRPQIFGRSRAAGFPVRTSAADKLSAAQTFDNFVGRAVVTSTGDIESVGYYAFLEGIPGPFFSGDPSEATAFFTFRTSPLIFGNLFVNGSLAWALADPSILRVYLNTTPQGDWNNPDSFSSGEPIATIQRSELVFTCNGDLTLLNTCNTVVSGALVSSQDFTFNGGTFNFKKLVPDGITNVTPLVDASFPGFAAVFLGYDLALKK